MSKSSAFLRHRIYKHGKFIYHDGSDFPFQFRASSIMEYLVADRKPPFLSFRPKGEIWRASIINMIRFLATLEMTAMDSFRSGIK